MEVRRGLTTKTVMNQVETGMDTPTPGEDIQIASDAPRDGQDKNKRTATRIPSIIVGVVAAAVAALSIFYLLRPEPLLVQGEVDATRLDIAARVDGRVKEIPVNRGQTRANESGDGCGRGTACQRTGRNARRSHRRAEGRNGACAGSAGAGAE